MCEDPDRSSVVGWASAGVASGQGQAQAPCRCPRQVLMLVEGATIRTRWLTPREAARLMGLPETYRLPDRVTAALQVAGDGVAVPVVRWLARQILEPALRPGPSILAAE